MFLSLALLRQTSRRWAGVGVLVGGLCLAGCSPYQLQGIVIQGTVPGIEIVDQDDARLDYFGVPEAAISVVLDPQRLQPEPIARGQSNKHGQFALPIEQQGAGFLILDVEVRVSKPAFRSVRQRFDLPARGQRLIVTLPRGEDRPSPDGGNILQDTLREAEPYLRE